MPKYSQNFLTSNAVANAIVASVGASKFEYLVEIGPGKGFLTKRLVEKFGNQFTAIEIDHAMINYLNQNISPLPKIINSDFLELDLNSALPHKKICFAGNLPYATSNPIMQKVLDFKYFNSAVFMFQKEVAERITAKTGQKQYSALSLIVQARASVKKIINVKKNFFNPPPKVDSAVVEFKKPKNPIFKDKDAENKFIKTVKCAFAYKRKTVLNSLMQSTGLKKERIITFLEKAQIDPGLRAQNITQDSFLKLSQEFI